MYPHERSLVAELQNQPFALIGVNSDNLERAKQAIEKNRLNWRSFQNKPEGSDQEISKAWRVRGWPTIVVIDKDFRIRYRGHSGDKATEEVRKLLAAMDKK